MALGRWYRKALYLLVDFKRYDLASEFAHEALKHFVFAGSAADQARVLVDIGFVQSHAGLARETIATLERALELLPKSDHTSRFGAHQILAKQRLKLGDQGGARNEFDAAIPLAGNDSLALAFLHWRRAKLATETGDKAAAIESFKAALPLFVQQAGLAELAGLAMDYAQFLFSEKRRPELLALAADLSGWIHQLRGNRKLRDTSADFLALLQSGGLSASQLQEIRQRFTKASPPRDSAPT